MRRAAQTSTRTLGLFPLFKPSCKCWIAKKIIFIFGSIRVNGICRSCPRQNKLKLYNYGKFSPQFVHFIRRAAQNRTRTLGLFSSFKPSCKCWIAKKIIIIFGDVHYSRMCRSCPRPNKLNYIIMESSPRNLYISYGVPRKIAHERSAFFRHLSQPASVGLQKTNNIHIRQYACEQNMQILPAAK